MRQYTNEVPDAARCILIWDALPTPPESYGKQIALEGEVGPPTSWPATVPAVVGGILS